MTAKRNSVSGKQAKRMLLNISGNTRGKMGAVRSFESFDFPQKINCLFLLEEKWLVSPLS